MKAHVKVLLFVGVVIMGLWYFTQESQEYKQTSNQEKLEDNAQEQAKKIEQKKQEPQWEGGFWRYGVKRIKLTSTPQLYTFEASGDWEGWYDNPATGLPFNVQFSPDGEILDCKDPAVNHPPLGEIWVSKKSGNPDHYVNFSYSYAKDNKMNPLNR